MLGAFLIPKNNKTVERIDFMLVKITGKRNEGVLTVSNFRKLNFEFSE